jgi:hypothetical protein
VTRADLNPDDMTREDLIDDPTHRGVVYFITSGETVKIGYTTHLGKRLGDLKTGSPISMTVMDYVRADKSIEAALQKALQSERLSGEWFTMSDKTQDLLYMVSDFVETFDDDTEDLDGRDAHILTMAELLDMMARPYHWAPVNDGDSGQ